MKFKIALLLIVDLFPLNAVAHDYTYVLPQEYPVQWDNLIQKNPSPLAQEFVRSTHVINQRLLHGSIPYPARKIAFDWEQGYQLAEDKFVFMRKYGVDCTRLLRYIFLNMLNLPYNSKYSLAPIISHTFTQDSSESQSQLQNFVQVPRTKEGFKPQTGDILAFPGHTVAVLDPANCIAIQSSIWLCKKAENGFCVDHDYGQAAGVSIYHLASERFCKNGIWKGMDNEKLKFTIGWRHKAFDTWIYEMPKVAKPGAEVYLTGKNLVNKYIYFTGSHKPVKTKLVKKPMAYMKDQPIQTVKVIVPADAKTGKLNIFWGTGTPKFISTVESSQTLTILTPDNSIASLHPEHLVD